MWLHLLQFSSPRRGSIGLRRKLGASMSSSFGPSKFGGGMKAVDRPSRNVGKAASADLTTARPKPKLKKVLPEIWKLIKPRRLLLAGSFPVADILLRFLPVGCVQ